MEGQNIKVSQLEEMIKKSFELKEEHTKIKEKAAKVNSEKFKLDQKIASILEELGKTSYSGEAGTFSYRVQESFKVPKDPCSRQEFFEYLKRRDVFEEMITVNSRTLQSFAKSEVEVAEQEGNFDFEIPGLIKSEPAVVCSLRKK